MTESVSICGLDLPDGSMCKTPADGPQQPCRQHKIAPPPGAARSMARRQLVSALESILHDAEAAKMIVVLPGQDTAVANFVLDQLTMHVALQVLSGMAAPPS